ncbi:MAG: CoA transferase, partial [Pseudomonadota bacterium]|nr:CoA transferase [Pseudomonadota bacterium]
MNCMLKKRDYIGPGRGTLDGVRVLDLSRLVAGNTLTGVLADFGAEVIKVEPEAGDTLRAWRTQEVQVNWKLYARNKKSLALELRNPESKALLLKLAAKADLFVESFRPDTLEQMGLGPEVLLAGNPKLVIVRISGWGQTGPYRRRPGFGTLVEGISGFASFNGFPDREPVLPPMYMADSYAGLYGAIGAMIALREVEVNGGKGQVIDLPLLDPLFHVLGPQAAAYRLTGKVKPRTGSRSTNSGPRNAYRASDGKYVALSASTQKMAERVFTSIGRSDLISDPRYRTNADRVKNAEELDAIIGEFVAA